MGLSLFITIIIESTVVFLLFHKKKQRMEMAIKINRGIIIKIVQILKCNNNNSNL